MNLKVSPEGEGFRPIVETITRIARQSSEASQRPGERERSLEAPENDGQRFDKAIPLAGVAFPAPYI
jgi:hypothetical protein